MSRVGKTGKPNSEKKLSPEAHPAENEDFKNQFLEIKTHKSLKDRLEAASKISLRVILLYHQIPPKMSCWSLRSFLVPSLWIT